jgi:hypothetical protein
MSIKHEFGKIGPVMVRPNLRALMNFSVHSHISTTGVKCDVKHNTMPQSSCGLNGGGEATFFSRGYMKFYLNFLYILTILIKLATDMSTKIYCFVKIGAVTNHALIGDFFFFFFSFLYNVGKIWYQIFAYNLMLLSSYEFRKNWH